MKITYKIGDILTDVRSGVIAHACNTEKTMGSGVALFLARKYPLAEQGYLQAIDQMEARLKSENRLTPNRLRNELLGTVSYVQVTPELHVANMITQLLEPKFNGKPTSLNAVAQCLESLNAFIKSEGKIKGSPPDLHLPLICAVRGGIDWRITCAMVETLVTDAKSVTVWVLGHEAASFEAKGWITLDQGSLM